MASSKATGMNRDVLARGDVLAAARARDGKDTNVLTDEQLIASRRAFIPDDYQGEDIWVFGYGSLISNPIVDFTEKQPAKIYGYHRRFCMWTRIGRGSPDCPGLVLALDNGGSTKGMCLRIPAHKASQELDILWRREMMADSYRPIWLQAKTQKGSVRALSFAIRRNRPIYAPPMSDETTASIIHKAVGFVGPCRDYLEQTYEALCQADIHDKQMRRLIKLVKQLDN